MLQLKQQLKLPVLPQTSVQVYLHYSTYLCAVTAHKANSHWDRGRFLNTFFVRSPEGHFLDYLTEDSLFEDVVEKEVRRQDEVKGYEIQELIIEELIKGRYILCITDEYYLPGRYNYGNRHFLSYLMIYGYDPEKRVYHGMISTKECTVELREYPEDVVHKSYNRGFEYIDSSPRWIEGNYFVSFMVKEGKTGISQSEMFNSLYDFYKSTEISEKLRPDIKENFQNITFGLECFSKAADLIGDARVIDLPMSKKYVYLLTEHCSATGKLLYGIFGVKGALLKGLWKIHELSLRLLKNQFMKKSMKLFHSDLDREKNIGYLMKGFSRRLKRAGECEKWLLSILFRGEK